MAKRIKKLRRPRTRIHREGRATISSLSLLLIAFCALGFWLNSPWIFAVIMVLVVFLLCFSLYFFRFPHREMEVIEENCIVAPADGKIVVIEPTDDTEIFHEKRLQVSIFMSPLNVHAQWYPIVGTVLRSEHQKGRHLQAWLPKSSTENERSLIVIETESKIQIALRQIAGAMARRIVTYAKPGDQAKLNKVLGFIKFGSRVDLYLPLDTEMYVKVGESVTGNETILGRLSDVPKKEKTNSNPKKQ